MAATDLRYERGMRRLPLPQQRLWRVRPLHRAASVTPRPPCTGAHHAGCAAALAVRAAAMSAAEAVCEL